MKYLSRLLVLFMLSVLVWSCDDDDEIVRQAADRFVRPLQTARTVPYTAGEATLRIECRNAAWEILPGDDATDDNIITSFTPSSGQPQGDERTYALVTVAYGENTGVADRQQKLWVVNSLTGERTAVKISQSSANAHTDLMIDPATKYQPVVGFGGMYDPIIWCRSYMPTQEEIEKLYSTDGMGYTVMRLMIYPNESDWSTDVEAAKYAQAQGAVIFACPWDCTDALADKVDYNGNQTKHLKHENYGAYADHIIKYIEYMKQNGINLYAVSMQNEPDMEFTYWTPAEVVDFVVNYGARIRATGVKLMSPETCGMRPDYTDAVINNPAAMTNTDIIAGHLYQGFTDLSSSYVNERHKYITGIYGRITGKTWWMTEHLFNDGESEEDSSKWIFGKWDYCLNNLAKEIHMTMEGFGSAYVYWYLKRFYGLMGDDDKRSPVPSGEITKNGYIMAHYAKYASSTTRVHIDGTNEKLMATAYVNEAGTEVTVVALNMRGEPLFVNLGISGAKSCEGIYTDADVNMQPADARVLASGAGVGVTLQPFSITSVRIRL